MIFMCLYKCPTSVPGGRHDLRVIYTELISQQHSQWLSVRCKGTGHLSLNCSGIACNRADGAIHKKPTAANTVPTITIKHKYYSLSWLIFRNIDYITTTRVTRLLFYNKLIL